MLGPKTIEKSLKGSSKSGKMGAAALPSQENIQESRNSSVPSTKNQILATQSQVSKSPNLSKAKSNIKPYSGKESYMYIVALTLIQIFKQPWTQAKYKSRKPS